MRILLVEDDLLLGGISTGLKRTITLSIGYKMALLR